MANQVVQAAGAIYGTRDAGRAWYQHMVVRLKKKGWRESRLDRALFFLNINGVTVAVMMSHVDDFLLAYDTRSAQVRKVMSELSKELHLVRNDSSCWEYCGKQFPSRPTVFG